eukprot:CAMPEP_0176432674 /NCGR_PEP_ID=MMETSP0127-20121128/15530_1 /TAXON_ID=938130 /ORGANISM="Platyophrya macrostoma, Strain WH" /LENGTH=93 /DNA_ID=CAMNT_0017814881 /DNA_START=62 /DNA_END=343 /DNA_ORIENTATION=-
MDSLSGELFLRKSSNNILIGFLLNVFFLKSGEELDVARGRAERSDSSVSSVGSSSAFLSLINLSVGNDKLVSIETLDISIGFEILEKSKDDLG